MTRRESQRREPVFGPAPNAGGRGRGVSPNQAPRRAKPARKRQKKRRSLLRMGLSLGATVAFWGVLAVAAVLAFHAAQLPPIDQLAVPKRPPNIAILAENGTLIANRGDTGGAAVKLKDLPPFLPKAFVAIEDRRFYSHLGIDVFAVLRALTRNVTAGSTVEGGSTLTQQLAKNLFLTQERTVSRKIQEAILAVWLEQKYTKDQILELYLNRVYFGAGAYGVEAAARKYFGHGARQVTLPEAAMLAGLVKAPTRLAPNRNPDGARARAAQVVHAMVEAGFIDASMSQLALEHPARVVKDQGAGSVNYAADYVMDVLDSTIGAIEEDILVTTTLSASLQAAAEKALTEELDRKGAKLGVSQGAIVAMTPEGAIKALVGGRDYAESQFNRAVSAKRQPGSAFKPFVFLAALEHGLTPATVREDAPINIKGWRPENYAQNYFGPVSLTKALALSLNTVAVRLGQEVGPKTVVATAHRLGITSDLDTNPSIALGTSEVSPLEIVAAYAPFANGGIGTAPQIILKVKTAAGKTLYQYKRQSLGRVIDPSTLSMMNRMMIETLITGTARKGEVPGWQAAGKTGTSQDWRDAWFIGYTSHLVAGVWLGNDDNSPTKRVSGGSLPVQIWSRFMRTAHQGVPPQPLPGGIWEGDNPLDGIASFLGSVATAVGDGAGDFAGQGERAPVEVGGWSAPVPAPQAPQQRAVDAAGLPYGEPERRRNNLVPPADIPNAGARQQRRAAPPQERNFFEQLFGG
jgi:penicillin-binding protein 1A